VFQPAQVRAYAKFHLAARQERQDRCRADCGLPAAVKKIHPPPIPAAAVLPSTDDDRARSARILNCTRTGSRPARDPVSRRSGGKRSPAWPSARGPSSRPWWPRSASIAISPAARPDLQCWRAGLPTAVAILVRMPEIGQLSREQVAALAGLAPYDDDSGEASRRSSHPRRAQEAAPGALCRRRCRHLFRWNPQLIALYTRLKAAEGTQALPHRLRQEAAHLRQHRRGPRHAVGKMSRFQPPRPDESVSWFDRSTVSSSRPAAPTTSRADSVKDGRRSNPSTPPCHQATP